MPSAAIAIITRPQGSTRHLKIIRQKLAIITTEKNWTVLQQCIKFNVKKVVVTILQGSVVTQTMLGGLTTYPLVTNFL